MANTELIGAVDAAIAALTKLKNVLESETEPDKVFDETELSIEPVSVSVPRSEFRPVNTGNNCPKCGAPYTSGSKFCLQCGSPIGQAPVTSEAAPAGNSKICLNCGTPLTSRSRFCLKCGAPV